VEPVAGILLSDSTMALGTYLDPADVSSRARCTDCFSNSSSCSSRRCCCPCHLPRCKTSVTKRSEDIVLPKEGSKRSEKIWCAQLPLQSSLPRNLRLHQRKQTSSPYGIDLKSRQNGCLQVNYAYGQEQVVTIGRTPTHKLADMLNSYSPLASRRKHL
jgi:hypothetical protein